MSKYEVFLVRIQSNRENPDQKNSVFKQFSRSENLGV